MYGVPVDRCERNR